MNTRTTELLDIRKFCENSYELKQIRRIANEGFTDLEQALFEPDVSTAAKKIVSKFDDATSFEELAKIKKMGTMSQRVAKAKCHCVPQKIAYYGVKSFFLFGSYVSPELNIGYYLMNLQENLEKFMEENGYMASTKYFNNQ